MPFTSTLNRLTRRYRKRRAMLRYWSGDTIPLADRVGYVLIGTGFGVITAFFLAG